MTTVMVFGTFDILHFGHLHLFHQAKRLADKLVVVVARDCNVKKIKGVLPINNEKERLELIKHVDIVDNAILGDKNDIYKVVLKIKPDVIALGYDQEAEVEKLKDYKIKRLRPYKPEMMKSSKIKEKISRMA